MNDTRWTFVALAGGLAVCGLLWMFVPSLQSADRTVESLASRHLETARRLLNQYDPGLSRHGAILSDLRSAEIGYGEGEWSDDVEEEFQTAHESIWAAYQPTDWSSPRPSAAKASYGNMTDLARKGVKSRDDLVKDNERLLKDSLSEIEVALAVSAGDAQGRTHAEANRLKGFIELHLGLAKAQQATILRGPTLGIRRELRALASTARQAAADLSLVADSGVDDLIAEKRKEMADAQARVTEQRTALEQLERKIADLKARISDAEARRATALERMRSLRQQGIKLGSPEAAESFAREMRDADEAYRKADREAQSLTQGDFATARIDASGDYLRGKYVENGSSRNVALNFGLRHYEGEHRVLAAEIRATEGGVAEVDATIAALQAQRDAMVAREATARERAAKARETGKAVFEELDRVESAAFEVEDEALNSLRRAAGTLKQAANYSNQWTNDAREATSSMSPTALERSAFKVRSESGWLSGFAMAESTDALLAAAWIQYARYEAGRRTAAMLADAGDLLGDIDAKEVQTESDEARQAGLELVKNAMADLEKAHRDTNKHWTLVAQAGNANYLLVLLGDKSYATDALEAYRKSIQGREQEPFAAVIASRIRQLEGARQ